MFQDWLHHSDVYWQRRIQDFNIRWGTNFWRPFSHYCLVKYSKLHEKPRTPFSTFQTSFRMSLVGMFWTYATLWINLCLLIVGASPPPPRIRLCWMHLVCCSSWHFG